MKQILIIFLLITTLLSCKTLSELLNNNNASPPTNWFTDRAGLNHTASSNESVSLPLNIKWSVNLGGQIIGTPIGTNTGLIVPSGSKILSLNVENGSIIWEYNSSVNIHTTPTNYSENKGEISRIAFVNSQGDITSLDAYTGTEVWKSEIGEGTFNSSTNYASGVLFYNRQVSGNRSMLTVVNSEDGEVIWEEVIGNITTTTPLHGFGDIFNGGCQQSINPYKEFNLQDGNLENELSTSISNTTMCFTNGVIDYDVELNQKARIYIGLGGNNRVGEPAYIKSIEANNFRDIWETELENGEITGMSLTQNRQENIFIVSQHSHIHRIQPESGNILWTIDYEANSAHGTSKQIPQPVIWGNSVFHISNNRVLKAYNLSDGSETFQYDISCETYSSPIVGGGHLYVGCGSGIIMCFEPG